MNRRLPKVSGIYKIESPTGKVYIGQSYHIYDRWEMHKWYAQKFYKYAIYRSFKKHGIESHKFTIVHQLPLDVDKEVITNYEQLYMDAYRECGAIMLNMTTEAGTTKGRMHTEEAKKKMSDSRKKNPNWQNGVLKAAEINKGNKYSLGHRHSDETKKRMSESHIGNTSSVGNIAWNKGKKMSEECRKKMSESGKLKPKIFGRLHSDESKKKMSECHKGKILTEEHRLNIIKSLKGRVHSEETKRKIGESGRITKQKNKLLKKIKNDI